MQSRRWFRGPALAAFVASSLAGCAGVQESIGMAAPAPPTPEEIRAAAVEAVPSSPVEAPPAEAKAERIWRRAVDGRGLRVVVSTGGRALWVLRDTATLFRAPIAVGTDEPLTYRGKTYDFTTPIGVRKVLGRDTNPLWVPPDWHYFEIAVDRGLEPVQLKPGSRVKLSDGSRIEVRGKQVGRVNTYGNFWPFSPGSEIVFDGKVFIPPFGTDQRKVPEVLGTHKLVLGDGYLIHGTNEEDSIGEAVSHGCVRMFNEHVAQLFEMVPNGTPVYIY